MSLSCYSIDTDERHGYISISLLVSNYVLGRTSGVLWGLVGVGDNVKRSAGKPPAF